MVQTFSIRITAIEEGKEQVVTALEALDIETEEAGAILTTEGIVERGVDAERAEYLSEHLEAAGAVVELIPTETHSATDLLGRVVDTETAEPLAFGGVVTVAPKSAPGEPLGEAVIDDDGGFVIEGFTETVADQFGEERPELVFTVSDDEQELDVSYEPFGWEEFERGSDRFEFSIGTQTPRSADQPVGKRTTMPDPERDPIALRKKDETIDDGDPGGGIDPIPLEVVIESPVEDLLSGPSGIEIHVTGTTEIIQGWDHSVQVRLGEQGEYEPAQLTSTIRSPAEWSYTGTVTFETSDDLTIYVRATATNPSNDFGLGVGSAEREISIHVDDTPPSLTVPIGGETVEAAGFPYELTFRGLAFDGHEVELVECGLKGNALEPATNETGDWRRWYHTLTIEKDDTPTPTIVVRATDKVGNVTEVEKGVTVITAPPTLTIETTNGKEWSEKHGLTVEMSGAASDVGSGVRRVGWSLNGDDFQPTTDTSNPGEVKWSRWSKSIDIPSPDIEEIIIRAEDRAGLTTEKTVPSIWQLFFQALLQSSG